MPKYPPSPSALRAAQAAYADRWWDDLEATLALFVDQGDVPRIDLDCARTVRAFVEGIRPKEDQRWT